VSEVFSTPIEATTRCCAVYGHPVAHSASPAMQNAGIAALGLNWRYLAFEVHPDHLREAIAGAKAMKYVGLNLTVPHKLLAMEIVDVLDDSARIWGAVNTIRFEAKDQHGEWQPLNCFSDPLPDELRSHGFNTDAAAISQSLREDLGLELAGTKVLLLGTGGAGRVAALKLASEKVSELYLVNRTSSKAKALAAEIQLLFPNTKTVVGYADHPVDLVLNATSLGLKPGDPLPWSQTEFSLAQAGFVYDMIYRPVETPLLQAAKAAGCRVANGLGMLLYQGAKALELWSGQKPPILVMRAALRKNVYG
jgi:shikimate dehydrogenase